MEKKKKPKKEVSNPMRIPIHQKTKLKEIGEGKPREGLTKVLAIYDELMANPERIIMQDVDVLMTHLRLYYSDNHYNHFDNFPAVMRKFLKSGHPDFSIMMSKRFEKNLEEFDKP